MSKKTVAFLVCVIWLTACASPETMPETVAAGVNQASDIRADQGRVITETLQAGEDMLITIDAEVVIPEGNIEKGEFSHSLPSVEEIETLLTNGEKMEEDEYNTWQINADAGSENAFKSVYYIDDNAHRAYYQNASIKTFGEQYRSFTVKQKGDTLSDDERQVIENYSERASAVMEALGVSHEISEFDLNVSENDYEAVIYFETCIDQLPVVDIGGGITESYIEINDEGIIGCSFYGSLRKESSEQAALLSVDEVMTVVESQAEMIGGLPSDIVTIRLCYVADFESGTFYPVWCFVDEDDFVVIMVNAETGEIL